jgi:hypothetical protein
MPSVLLGMSTIQKLPSFRPQSRIFRDGMANISIDGRSRLGRYLRALRIELADHAAPDGRLSVVQRQLIDLLIADAHQLVLFDEKLATEGRLTAHERREHSAVRGRYERTIARLGLKAAAAKPTGPTMADLRAAAQQRAPAA